MNTHIKNFYNKYIKYKNKYLYLKNIKGGNNENYIKAIAFFNTNTINGIVEFEEISNNSVKIIININGFVPGSIHGIHVHETGDLSKGCDSMCAHFNPFNKTHGGREDSIRHVGDLGNICANAEGLVQIEFIDNMIKLRGDEANIIGRGLIIHEDKDDCGKTSHELSKTTGNSGKRIACAIIGYASKCNK
jgi:Cu-Zn family superoxide dismutase